MNAPNTLPALVAAWGAAKAAESAANARRLEIEGQIVAAMPSPDPEGIVTADAGDFRVKVAYKVTRKVDTEQLQELWPSLPDNVQAVFRWKAEIKSKELRGLQQYLPDQYRLVAGTIEAKPAKPSVAVEPIEKETA